MTITRNLTAEVYADNGFVIVEISDATDMVHTFKVSEKGQFVRNIDRKLRDNFFQRTTPYENLPDTRCTFKVDHYGE